MKRLMLDDVKTLIESLRRHTCRNFDVRAATNGYVLYEHNFEGNIDISPRLSVPELYRWIEAYLLGVKSGYRLKEMYKNGSP